MMEINVLRIVLIIICGTKKARESIVGKAIVNANIIMKVIHLVHIDNIKLLEVNNV